MMKQPLRQQPVSLEEFLKITRGTRRTLKWIEDTGISFLPMEKPSPAENGKSQALEPVRLKALSCRECRLCKERNSVVFGEGSLDAQLVFVGEGPGRDEDAQGRPFVGAAGALLTKMIQAMGFKRESVYIANVVKCRPPMNRVPEPDEISACFPYLEAQLKIIRPKVICALGKTAALALLQMEAPLGQLRGKTFAWNDIPLIVTYHPAYLLRNPPAKAQVWEDLKRALNILSPG